MKNTNTNTDKANILINPEYIRSPEIADDDITSFTSSFGSYANYEEGSFRLTSEGSAILLNSNLITSVSGGDEWAHHHICELIDLYSGQSEFNCCFDAVHTEHDLCYYRRHHPDDIVRWFNKVQNKLWYKLAEESFDSLLRLIANNSDKLSG